jgi:hypothetical protein
VTIQRKVRRYLVYRRNGGAPSEERLHKQRAAVIIQRAFRAHLSRKIDQLILSIIRMQAQVRGVLGRQKTKRTKIARAFEWLEQRDYRRRR